MNQQTRIALETPKDYHFGHVIRYLTRSESECLHQVEENTVYKALVIRGEPVLMAIGMGDSPGGQVSIRFLGGTPDSERMQEASDYVKEWLDLGTDLGPFYDLAQSDPLLGPVVEQRRGLRLIGVPSLLEALSWTVIGQQINLAFAYNLKKRLVENFGTCLQHEGREFRLFPEAGRLAEVKPEELQSLQFSRTKAETLLRVARLVADGGLSKEQLQAPCTLQEAEAKLTAIKGIGPWTAHYVAMRCLRFTDAFPLTDVGLHNAIRLQLGDAQKPPLALVEELASAWRPWRGYATFYLWSTLGPA